jgi:hypothetical protein
MRIAEGSPCWAESTPDLRNVCILATLVGLSLAFAGPPLIASTGVRLTSSADALASATLGLGAPIAHCVVVITIALLWEREPPDAMGLRRPTRHHPGETAGEPVLSHDRAPSRLAWAVSLTAPDGATRNLHVAGRVVWEAPPADAGIDSYGGRSPRSDR